MTVDETRRELDLALTHPTKRRDVAGAARAFGEAMNRTTMRTHGGILGLPVIFVVDRNARIVARHEGDTAVTATRADLRRWASRPQ